MATPGVLPPVRSGLYATTYDTTQGRRGRRAPSSQTAQPPSLDFSQPNNSQYAQFAQGA